jgi:hypothetical protein
MSDKKEQKTEEDKDGSVYSNSHLSSGRVPVSTLTKMMFAGENNAVMKYLRTLPKEECDEVRTQLIKNLEG